MKILVVCGSPLAGWEAVGPVLAEAGLAEALPDQTRRMSMDTWHEQVCGIYDESLAGTGARTRIRPGKIWQDILTDLVLVNASRPVWGWLDARSTWLLDFWRELDSQTRFLCLYRSPGASLAHRAVKAGETLDIVPALHEWMEYHRELLRFCAQNPERALLVNADEALRDPSALIMLCQTALGLPLRVPASGFSVVPSGAGEASQPVLVELLLENLLASSPDAPDLFQEIEAQSRMPAPGVPAVSTDRAAQAFQAYLDIAGTLRRTGQECHQAQEESARLLQDLEQQRKDLDDLRADRDSVVEKLQQTTADWEAGRSEADLTLVQLHQVQEEFERFCLTQQEQKAYVDGLLEQARMEFERQRLIHLEDKKQFDQQLEQIRKEVEMNLAKIGQLQQELDGVTNDLQNALKELEQSRLAHATEKQQLGSQLTVKLDEMAARHEGQIRKLEQKESELARALERSRQEQEGLRKELGLLTAERTAAAEQLERQGKELQEMQEIKLEAELNLLQLQQTQEELEHYFMANLDQKTEIAMLKKFWDVLATQWPEIGVAEEVAIIEHFRSGNYAHLHFAIRNYAQGGQIWPLVRFKLVSRGGCPALELRPLQDSDMQIIARWPADSVDKHGPYLLLCPDEAETARAEHMKVLESLGSEDWKHVMGVVKLMAQSLRRRSVVAKGEFPDFDLREWLVCADRLQAGFETVPSVVRVDAVKLNEQYRVKGYEHLTLALDNLHFGLVDHPQFVVKLQATGVTEQQFPDFPGMEFRTLPDHSAPFEAWPLPTGDQFGPYLRWLPHKEAGLAVAETVLGRLTESDVEFLRALLARLPNLLADLARENDSISRPWEDWIGLAVRLREQTEAFFGAEDSAETVPAQEEAIESAESPGPGISLLENHHVQGYEHLSLLLENQPLGGAIRSQLAFKLLATGIVEHPFTEFSGIEFRLQSDGSAPFEAWPPATADQFGACLRLFPHKEAGKALADSAFGPLTENDRRQLRALLEKLPGLLGELAQAGAEISRPWQDWIDLSRELHGKVEALLQPAPASTGVEGSVAPESRPAGPEAKGEGGVELAECYRTGGYEHLSLVLQNQWLAGRIRPHLNFKLLATGIGAERFTAYPGIEFRARADGSAPFEAWPPATEDAYGAYLRLLPHKEAGKALGDTAFGRLTENDRKYLRALLEELPGFLEELAKTGVDVARPWQDWIDLSRELHDKVEAVFQPPLPIAEAAADEEAPALEFPDESE